MPERTGPDDRPALWTLRIALCGMAVGVASNAWIAPDAISGWLYVEREWVEEDRANALALGFATLFALAGILLLTPLARVGAVWVAVWTLVLLTVQVARDPYWPEVAPASWAVRWLGPIALLVWLGRVRAGRPGAGPRVEWMLRVAAAATFAGHGIKALGFHPRSGGLGLPNAEYLDFAHVFEVTLLGAAWSQDANVALLRGVGALDLVVAVLLLVRRWPAVAAWMGLWGLFTASLRLMQYEETGMARFLTRLPNAGVPFVLLWLWLGTRGARRGEHGS